MKLNIAFYTDTYLPAVDGVVNSILNFKKELERRGHSVYIFGTYNISSGRGDNRRKGHDRDVFLYPGVRFKPYPQYSMALFPYNSISKLSRLNIDIIHAHTPFFMGFAGLISSMLANYPIIGSYHTMLNNRAVVSSYYPKNKQLKRLTSKYMLMYIKFFYKRCNITAAPSGAIRDMLMGYGIGNVMVVPNGIDTKFFNPNTDGHSVRKGLGISGREKVVLYVGRLGREKKLEVLLRAARRILGKRNDVKFLIAGAGPAGEYYKGMAARLGVSEKVHFMGYVTRNMLPKVYAASDLFCMPSTFETQGMVALEAMASGKPVVAADSLALSELVRDLKNGEKFIPGDYIDCAKKIEKVLNNSDSYIRETVKTAKEFSIAKTTDRLLDAYKLSFTPKAID